MKSCRYILFTLLMFCAAKAIAVPVPVNNVNLQRQAQLNQGLNDYYLDLQIPPGNPTQPNVLGQPEITGEPLPTVIGDYTIPRGWPVSPYFNPPGGPPGPPVQFGNPVTNDNVTAGYGYVSNSLEERDLYFYHPDHLGSTSIITDRQGVATQFVAYLPFGESLVEEHNSSWENLYLFSGKELDASTSLYYFGARYYDPEASIWYGIDPLTERHPNIGGMVYCFDSPTKVIDPTGEDGIVVVDEETKSITIKANIILYSKEAGVGRASLDKAAKEYKKNIMDNWSKDANGNAWTTEHNGETYTVNFDVDVSVNTQAAYEKNRDYNGMNNYIEVKGNSRFRSEVSGDMQNGRWAIPTPESNHAAHEFGHLIGLMDRYTDVYNDNGRVTGSIPHSGWKGNIMADNGRVEQRNINNIFNRRNSPSTSLLSENRPKYLLPFGVYIFKINNRNRSERYKM